MSLLRTIESRIATLVEGTFGRVFRANVQPVEIARRLVKEMDDNKRASVRNVYVPNLYEVFLSRDDHRQFREMQKALETELAEYLAEHARRNGYALTARPRVTVHMDRDLDVGSFGIATTMEQADGPVDAGDASAPEAAPVSQTMVYKSPLVPQEVPAGVELDPADFALIGADGAHGLCGARTSVGRGKSSDVVLHDSSVSREHAEIVVRGAEILVRDLDSTNGVMVNGSRVREQELAPGDRVRFGNAELRFERQGGSVGAP